VPADHIGIRLLTERTGVHATTVWLREHGWTVITSEIGYVAKSFPELNDVDREDVGNFLQALEDHEDVQRVWAAVK